VDAGVTVWFTGLSGSGKTTIALLVEERLRRRGFKVQRLDGDIVRQDLTADLGFSREDRNKNIARVAFVADLLTRNGVICLASFISPYREARERARQRIGAFVEVFLDCPVEVCIKRDVKGLYKRALAGEIKQFTGISDPYEPPTEPELILRTDLESPEESANKVIVCLEELGYLAGDGLIRPHGGYLINRIVNPHERTALPSPTVCDLEVDRGVVVDIDNLATGVYSPLRGFMGERDYRSVLTEGRLADGTPWTIPLLLHVPRDMAQRVCSGDVIGLSHGGRRLAVLEVDEVYPIERDRYCQATFGTTSAQHPGVASFNLLSEWVVGGPIHVFERPSLPFGTYRMTPRETRALFARRSWKTVAAFQTRNAPHIGHEYLQKTALTVTDGLLINPVIGKKKPGDFADEAIIAAFEALVRHYFPQDRTVLCALPYEMKYAGPREAIHHAIMRKNLGASHFIVGRDHAGVGDFYGPYDAQRIFDDYPDLGVTAVRFGSFYYCLRCGTVSNERVCPHGDDETLSFSGTAVRAALTGAMEAAKGMAAVREGGPTQAPLAIRPEVLAALRTQKKIFVGESESS